MRHRLYERMGRFHVRKEFLDELPDWLQQLMARVIVLKAGFSFEHDGVEYTALCAEFGKGCDLGSIAPVYHPVVQDGRFLRFEP